MITKDNYAAPNIKELSQFARCPYHNDFARIEFLRMVCSKFSYCIPLCCCSEWRYHMSFKLNAVYDSKFEHVTCWRGAVMSHFQLWTLMLYEVFSAFASRFNFCSCILLYCRCILLWVCFPFSVIVFLLFCTSCG
jgi:hypothetical protein